MFSEAWINLLISLIRPPAEEPLLHLSSFHPIFIYVDLSFCVCVCVCINACLNEMWCSELVHIQMRELDLLLGETSFFVFKTLISQSVFTNIRSLGEGVCALALSFHLLFYIRSE